MTISFASIDQKDIKTDCRYYSGYKPCKKSDGCPDCPHYSPRGTEILFIKLGAMGDVLRTKSLLTGLKRKHPQSWITWLTAPGSEPIVRDPLVDEIRSFNESGLLALEGRQFDLLLSLDKESPAVALSRRIAARTKMGYAPTPFNTMTVWNEASMYALRTGLSDELKYRINTLTHQQILYGMAELEYQGDEYGLTIPPGARDQARAVLERIGVPRGRPVLGINTGCGPVFETKAWTLDGFAATIGHFAQRGDVSVVLLGGKREEPLHRELMARAGSHAGRTVFDSGTDNALETFFALVGECDVVLSADSLAMHVAIALRRHVVAFFGPTCEQEVDLFGRGEKIVTDFGCSPCYLKRCDVRPSCMMAMTPQTVNAAIDRAFAHARATR